MNNGEQDRVEDMSSITYNILTHWAEIFIRSFLAWQRMEHDSISKVIR
jgi:hypothetical protein